MICFQGKVASGAKQIHCVRGKSAGAVYKLQEMFFTNIWQSTAHKWLTG
jgi:hypothetical protein